jgi:hypothetical protein
MKDRYWMVKWATDQLLEPPEPEEDREEEEPIPPRRNRHPQDIYTDWPSNEQCEAFKRGWR